MRFWFTKEPPALPGDIELTEVALGRTLPARFKKLLLEQNGGVSNYAGYSRADLYVSLPPLLGVAKDPRYGTVLGVESVRRELGIPDGIVLFAAEGHEWLGFDYRENDVEPPVVTSSEDGGEIEVVARSFDDFLDGLIGEGEIEDG